jgi:hypothetical protein
MHERTIEQWECPPLQAWISRAQCERNRERAGSSERRQRRPSVSEFAKASPSLRLEPCRTCRGVVWWARQTGQGPRRTPVATLLRQSSESEATRRRLAGVQDGT